jgi:hypothetical protein
MAPRIIEGRGRTGLVQKPARRPRIVRFPWVEFAETRIIVLARILLTLFTYTYN